MLTVYQVNFAKRTLTYHCALIIDIVAVFELKDTLLAIALTDLERAKSSPSLFIAQYFAIFTHGLRTIL